MQARALLTPLSAVAAIALLSCVDTTRPDPTLGGGECQPLECAGWEVAVDGDNDGCPDGCETVCALDCDCYAAIGGPPDDTCEGPNESAWMCNNQGRCVTFCASLTTRPDCHAHPIWCDASSNCGDGLVDRRNYCARPPGMCGASQGVCTRVDDPFAMCPGGGPDVCGCDDNIYLDLCDAIANGVSVRGAADMCFFLQ